MAFAEGKGRTKQKARTQRTIVEACVELIRQGQPVTMPEVAKAAMVSEATAYRYFPDLASLLARALAADWPTPTEALAPVATSNDPVERVGFATRFLLLGVAERQAVVRSMISATISASSRDLSGRARSQGLPFCTYRGAPWLRSPRPSSRPSPADWLGLRLDLAVVVSAEALFCLTDLCGLSVGDAIASAEKTARTLTSAAFQPIS